ncbi:hypothetical protein EYF80_040031 [Liparis tanakae]|uniref:Uncharacterized protein n=1 Tax=Liparis tanakae TaxID=230148 RepID=A0A4Z2G897_9TELE|nr:hypothetical protein EYF80_040031 [Liparis tanakae]
MPLFLARGHPDRLQDRRHICSVTLCVCLGGAAARGGAATVPPVGGVVPSDVSGSIAAGGRTPGAQTQGVKRRFGLLPRTQPPFWTPDRPDPALFSVLNALNKLRRRVLVVFGARHGDLGRVTLLVQQLLERVHLAALVQGREIRRLRRGRLSPVLIGVELQVPKPGHD